MATRGGFLLRRAPNFLLYRPKFAARSFAAAAGHSEPPRRNATRTAVGHDSAIVAGWPASVETAITPQSSALAGKPLRDLVRGWFVFKMLSYDWVVRHCLTVWTKLIVSWNIIAVCVCLVVQCVQEGAWPGSDAEAAEGISGGAVPGRVLRARGKRSGSAVSIE